METTQRVLRFSPVVAAAFLAACGGGGGGGDNPPPVTPGQTFFVSGNLSGLGNGKSVTLQNNASDDLVVSQNGRFSFVKALNSGSAYAVTVSRQPDGQTCTVNNGSGNVNADVSNVVVSCVTNTVTPPPVTADQLVGRWVPHTCGDADVGGADTFYRYFHQYAKSGANTLLNTPGRYSYSGANCSGTRTQQNGTVATESAQVLRVESAGGFTIYRLQASPLGPDGRPMAGAGYQRTITFASGGLVCMMSHTESSSADQIARDTASDIADGDLINCGTWER